MHHADKILDFALDAGGSINSLELPRLKIEVKMVNQQPNQTKGMLWKSYLKTMQGRRTNQIVSMISNEITISLWWFLLIKKMEDCN